jgi:hypothetical protein
VHLAPVLVSCACKMTDGPATCANLPPTTSSYWTSRGTSSCISSTSTKLRARPSSSTLPSTVRSAHALAPRAVSAAHTCLYPAGRLAPEHIRTILDDLAKQGTTRDTRHDTHDTHTTRHDPTTTRWWPGNKLCDANSLCLWRAGNGEWMDKEKRRFTVLWRSPAQWGEIIYKWVCVGRECITERCARRHHVICQGFTAF